MFRISIKYLINYIDHNLEASMNLIWHLLQRRNANDMLSNNADNDAIMTVYVIIFDFQNFEPSESLWNHTFYSISF